MVVAIPIHLPLSLPLPLLLPLLALLAPGKGIDQLAGDLIPMGLASGHRPCPSIPPAVALGEGLFCWYCRQAEAIIAKILLSMENILENWEPIQIP